MEFARLEGVPQTLLKGLTITMVIKRFLNGMILQVSGQIIATSHDLTPNGGLVREIPLFQGNLGWWNIIIWPDLSNLLA